MELRQLRERRRERDADGNEWRREKDGDGNEWRRERDGDGNERRREKDGDRKERAALTQIIFDVKLLFRSLKHI